MRRGLLAPAIAALSACSFAPPYHVPASVETPAAYKESVGWNTAQPSDQLPKGAWWTIFGDAELNTLENKAADANQNLKAALARLAQARADTRIARADLFPSLSLRSSAIRARSSVNSPQYIAGARNEGVDFDLEADFSYEVDLWGRVRNEVAAARANQQASAADLAALRLSLQAELASDYFGLRSYDAQEQFLTKTVEDYRKALELEQTLFDGGAVALSDLEQAKAQLNSAQSQAADIHLLRAQLEHAIAVLVGENPSVFALPVAPIGASVNPPVIASGLPSALLERRPDVAEAERRVAAANAQIGVARAAYFPQFILSADAGFNSVRAAKLIEAPSLFWAVGPQVSLPLFEGGRLLAQTARAKAVYAEQVADYRQAVLTAYQDVENNLIALRQLEIESDKESRAVEATRITLEKSQDRYLAGLVTYLEVATTETQALQAELSQINIQTRRLEAAVLLIKALGGGWSDKSTPGAEN